MNPVTRLNHAVLFVRDAPAASAFCITAGNLRPRAQRMPRASPSA